MTVSETTWHAWHLHVPGPDVNATDEVIRVTVGPAVDWLAATARRPWFFVRYWQFGPHVRLRVAGLDAMDADHLERRLRADLNGVMAGLGEASTAREYRRWAAPIAAAGEGGRALEVGDLLTPGLHAWQYQPETARYGGAALMAISERLFQTSSELALAFLRRRPPEGARCGLGLQGTRVALDTLATSAARATFCRRAGTAWDNWGARAVGNVPRGAPDATGDEEGKGAPAALAARPVSTPAPLRRWASELTSAMAHWRRALGEEAAEGVLASHVHMLHNRLGLTVAQERRHYEALALAVAR